METYLPIMSGLLVILCSILTYFITGSLRKIDNFARIEVRLEQALVNLNEVTKEVKSLFGKNINLGQEIVRLKEKSEALESRLNRLEQRIYENEQ